MTEEHRMRTSTKRVTRTAVFAGAALLAVVAAACGSGGGDVTPPTRPSTTTTPGATTTTREPPTTEAGGGIGGGGGITTTTDAGPTTSTTRVGPTTTTEAPTTTTTRASTTTTRESTTTTEAESGTTVVPTTIDATTASSSSSSPWLWVGAIALLVIAALVALFAILRSRKAKQARWLYGARDVSRRSTDMARSLDQAAAVLGGPAGADRQVWLDAGDTLNGLAASAAALIPDAPKVPGDPEGTNSLATSLESLRSDLTVCRSAAVEAERTRFELVGPTPEQLDFASQTVQRSTAAVIADAHAVSAAVDRVDPPPTPATPR
jgi:hypothetical protein